MIDVFRNSRLLTSAIACAVTTLLPGTQAAYAQTIVDSWKSVAVPSPPELQSITVDSERTALLIIDINANSCNEAQKPRCIHSIPRIQQLLAEARAHKMKIIYSEGPPSSTNLSMPPDTLKPLPDELIVRTVADKFIGSDLEKMLTASDIQSVIITGTSAEGGVLYTTSGAALRNIKAIVPLDAISSADPFGELAAAWILKNAAAVSSRVTLTKTDLITIR